MIQKGSLGRMATEMIIAEKVLQSLTDKSPVLLIDDDESFIGYLVCILEKVKRPWTIASTYEQAIECFKVYGQYKIAFIDHFLGDKLGTELIPYAHKAGCSPIMVSANEDVIRASYSERCTTAAVYKGETSTICRLLGFHAKTQTG